MQFVIFKKCVYFWPLMSLSVYSYHFLMLCIHTGMVAPRVFHSFYIYISSVLRPSEHIFPNYICSYLVSSVHELKFSEINTFEQARLLGLELRRKHGMSHNTANQLRSEISRINNNHISKLRSKFISLCNNSRWKKLGRADLVNNISSINLSPTET